MEETGVLEKVNLSGFCYLALNQVNNSTWLAVPTHATKQPKRLIQEARFDVCRLIMLTPDVQ
jgi:hypothetical protein